MFESKNLEATCGFTEEVSTVRFIYISLAGGVAILGCMSNMMLLYLFTFRQIANSPPQTYPAILAFLDALLCSFFILIFVVDVNMIYQRNEWLFVTFHHYIIITFCLAKLIQFLIPYLLILGTVERYTWIDNRNQKMSILQPRFQPFTLVSLFIVAAILRIPSLLALTVTEFPGCPDFFRTLAVDVKEWAQDSTVYMIYDVYGIACLQTFCPFLILTMLNLVIVNKLAKLDAQQCNRSSLEPLERRRKSRVLSGLRINKLPTAVRNAIYTMVAIVSTYLISNSLHILLTLLEVAKSSILVDSEDDHKASMVHTVLGDSVSILYMTSSAVRVLIYAYCNPAIRQQVAVFFGRKNEQRKESEIHLRCSIDIPMNSLTVDNNIIQSRFIDCSSTVTSI